MTGNYIFLGFNVRKLHFLGHNVRKLHFLGRPMWKYPRPAHICFNPIFMSGFKLSLSTVPWAHDLSFTQRWHPQDPLWW